MAQYSNPLKPTSRADVIAYARDWLGTPYVHQACKKHVGCDCLGLLRGVWKDIYEADAERPPNYTPYWAEVNAQGGEPMLEAANKYLVAKPLKDLLPGDVLMIRMRSNSLVKHCGIVSYNHSIIHAYIKHNVVEEDIWEVWRSRNMYAYSFPGVGD